MPTPNTLLRRERQLRGWSQAYLAQQINVPDYYISRWERGDVSPSPYYQQKLCELLGKTAEELGMLQAKNVDAGERILTNDLPPSNDSAPLDVLTIIEQEQPTAAIPFTPLPISTTTQTSGEQWDFPPIPQTQPEMAVATPEAFTKTRFLPRKRVLLIGLIVLLIIFSSVGSLFLLTRPRTSTILPPSTAGYLYFLSSGQINDTSNQGIADQVQVQLHLSHPPVAGNSDYAWLLPDDAHAEDATIFPLGTLTIHGESANLFYNDPNHTNLLAVTSHLLVTEESTTIPPLTPSIDTHTWRYTAQIPYQIAPGQTYSFLDHLRHLLAADPKLHAHHLLGGLAPWLSRNTQAAYAQILNARETWQANQTASGTVSMRHNIMSLLYYLDGAPYVQDDFPTMPSASSLLLDSKAVEIGLLQMRAQQEPPSYLSHVTQHLLGLSSSPGATPSLRNQITQIMVAINMVNTWLQQVRQDAKLLVTMTDQQLRQPQTTTLLNDLTMQMKNAVTGQQNAVTGNTQTGTEWISQSIEKLATVDIVSYQRS